MIRQVKSQKSKGKSQKCGGSKRGVTLVEMLIVVAIAGAMAAISLPAFSSGLDHLRLSQATDSVASFLSGGLNRAERRQQVIEVSVVPRENVMVLRSADNSFASRLAMPDGVRLEGDERHLILLPGATAARFAVLLSNRRGQRRAITIDPITGVPRIDKLDTP